MKKTNIRINFILIFFLTVINISALYSQTFSRQNVRDSLNSMFKNILIEKDDERKLEINSNIIGLLREILPVEEYFIQPVDSVKNIGVLKSNDKKLVIYTWNLPFNDGTHKYYGFIQYLSKDKKQPLVFELTDQSDEIKNPELQVLSNSNWYGSLIYKIVEIKHNRNIYYVLLSSDLNDLLTKKKIIDVLYFNNKDLPVFGARMFQNKPQNTRIIFEYNARANMALTYDETMKMIIFDHLSPSKPSLTGVYEFYGPDFSYDGYKFEKGIWVLQTDIDVRNTNN